ncbi:N-acetylmuramoyl-L-alanine amidase family protein [Candidatus Epulonipiscium viviparus]|uniref:N-acetylmuramoyl-L-alanine amidase family protein n=1 Tax=Candidatus Epulonipiscium viviparus TaxID=420336 RepID=UPI0027380F07|nr:N-acetylmuramoyl-L-alanine amidase [Candidatus Epulopiscium viviparus]
MLIVVDAGHGGNDSGAVGHSGLYEKNVVLKVARKLAELLALAGIEALLTRNSDTYLTLMERSTLANNKGAEYFISVHANSATNNTARGIETYVYSKVGKSYPLAQDVQKHLIAATGFNDRGVKVGNFSVLRETKMPAILVEIGFVSNPEEEALLSNDAFLDKIAISIYNGVAEYLNLKIETETMGQEAINRLFELGIIPTKYNPDSNVTWAQLATSLLRIINK